MPNFVPKPCPTSFSALSGGNLCPAYVVGDGVPPELIVVVQICPPTPFPDFAFLSTHPCQAHPPPPGSPPQEPQAPSERAQEPLPQAPSQGPPPQAPPQAPSGGARGQPPPQAPSEGAWELPPPQAPSEGVRGPPTEHEVPAPATLVAAAHPGGVGDCVPVNTASRPPGSLAVPPLVLTGPPLVCPEVDQVCPEVAKVARLESQRRMERQTEEDIAAQLQDKLRKGGGRVAPSEAAAGRLSEPAEGPPPGLQEQRPSAAERPSEGAREPPPQQQAPSEGAWEPPPQEQAPSEGAWAAWERRPSAAGHPSQGERERYPSAGAVGFHSSGGEGGRERTGCHGRSSGAENWSAHLSQPPAS